VEFGLLEQKEGLRIYGSGIVSSYSETRFALEDASPNRLRFNLERAMRTRYRIDDFQETYFVIRSLDELLQLAHIDFAPLYESVLKQSEFEPGDVLREDTVLTRGTGRYHAARRAG
jgi:phenylalanine-4-hydroxylase